MVDPAAEDPAAAEDLDAHADGGDPFELQPTAGAELPARPRRSRGPSMFGRAWITGGIGASSSHVAFGVGGVYFVIPWLGVGLDLDDTIVFSSPGYNLFTFTPKVVALALPYRRVSPLVQTGFGGAFFNKGLGSYGRWVAGVGVAMAFGRFNLRAGVDFDGLVPDSRFAQRFTCSTMSELTGGPCSLGLSPWLGFGFGF